MPASVTAIGHTIRTGFHMAVKGRTIGAAGGIGGAVTGAAIGAVLGSLFGGSE